MKRRSTYQSPANSVERFAYILMGSIGGCTFLLIGLEVFGL